MDTTKIDSHLVSKIIELSQDDAITSRPEGVEELYEEFLSKFPKSKITELTQEQYCLGQGSITDNYCRWIERELEPIFGRYMPGTARGHLLYLQKDGTLYKHQSLSDLSDDDALSYVLKIHQVIIDADVNADITWIDQDNEVYDRAGVEPRCVMGAGRRARLVSIYNPDIILPISSTVHIKHFLKALGLPESKIPPYKNVIQRLLMLTDVYQTIKKEHNLDLTPHQFMSVLYSNKLGIKPKKMTVDAGSNDELNEPLIANISNYSSPNQILYGPPGTGKTYSTTWRAVSLADPEWYFDLEEQDLDPDDQRNVVKERYDELVSEQRIAFTTFHQSFAYEDFVEGIRPIVVEGVDGSSNISYEVVDGIFKQLCTNARTTEQTGSTQTVNIEGKSIWKLSLGNTNISDENEIFNECIDNNYVLLGWGDDIDFSNCNNRREVVLKIEQSHNISLADDPNNYKATAVNTFKNVVSIGDLVIISDGNHKFRAIAEITGDYEFLDTKERYGFQQLRKVKWLRIYSPSLPKERLFDKSLSQMTIYQLRNTTINREKLKQLLTPEPTTNSRELPHLIIIDEINRGNISRIFGELITLLEPDKRKGGTDAREVILPYSKLPFSVPSNLYVLGTMNTADKSLAQLDLALRRRFDFIELLPKPELLDSITVHGIAVSEILTVINQRIEVLLDREHVIGHSYFWSLKDLDSDEEREIELGNIFKRRIIPLLQEYFFSDWERIGWVLNDPSKHNSERFIQTGNISPVISELFDSSIKGLNDRRYHINETAFNNPESYKKILIQTEYKSSDSEA
ncbi:AAA family ATPase [Psychrobacter sp. KFRI-CH2-11]|uniref:AAA family ATPase n=1 Tax=Psychrobacter sp. KFRI-CH2-11 TaxID=3156079 RepID=UPI00324520CE